MDQDNRVTDAFVSKRADGRGHRKPGGVRQMARDAGVPEATFRRHLRMATKGNALPNVTEGYDPEVKTERVQAFLALWKQMDTNERDHVIRLILRSKEGKSV